MRGTAVVTGCNRGLGLGIASELWKKYYEVQGINRTPASINWYNYAEHICDVGNAEEVDKINITSDINVLVLNAGIRRFGTVDKLSIEDWQSSVNTNLNGVFYVTRKLLDNVKRAKGDIIIIGSHSEKYTFETGSAYCSTKGALREFAECLMQEVRYDDVRVSYLSLGSIKNRDHGMDESWKLTPEDVGKAVFQIISLPKNIMLPYVDIRPAKPLKDERPGIKKLQYV